MVCADGRYQEGEDEKRAAIFIGPEFGTVARPDLVEAAREAADGGFDVLIACAFNYEAHTTEFNKLGRIPVLKARMNADLHMAEDLKNTGKGNLFVIFGEPDIDILEVDDQHIQVKVNGVDVFHPNTGEVRSDGPGGIACCLSIPITMKKVSLFARPTSWVPMIPTRLSRPLSKRKSMRKPGKPCTAILHVHLKSPPTDESRSR